MNQEYSKTLARFYDQIYHQLRDGVDYVFFQKEIIQTKGKILEVGVGTGRLFFRYELEHLIERSNFKEYRITGDYLGNELNPKSKEFIIICRKIK